LINNISLLKSFPHLLSLFVIGCIVLFSECSSEKIKPVVLVARPELVNEEVSALIQKQLSVFDTSKTLVIERDSLFATKLVIEFYRQNKFKLVWSDKGKYSKQSDSLYSLIGNSDDYGLIPSDYHFGKIWNLINTEKDSATKKFDAVKISKADILLTDAFFTFAVHLNKGRLNMDSLIREWKISKVSNLGNKDEGECNFDLVCFLNDAIRQNTIYSVIDSLEPKNAPYQSLKFALKNFKFEFKDSEWDSLSTRESDSVSFNERLKNRLVASHDYAEIVGNSDSINLIKAIKNFQCRHNLTEDGKVGKLTFKALQRTKQDYIRQIQMNMERWRNYYPPYEKQFVWVNVPKYEMRVIEKNKLIMKSNVIVGQPDHQTPSLKSTICYFLIYPYWTVPLTIATKEILPILKRDTTYLLRKNFEVLDWKNRVVDYPIKWSKYNKNYFPWKLRQKTGDENSLGILKFNFENKYGVYLHDTDNHRLFKREMRALSHGCVRLEKFIDFAKFLIRDDSVNYPLDTLKMDLLKEEQKYVYIKHPIPIYINYFTTEVGENNELFFFMDVYKKDEKMLKSLYHH
jgi:murein L,D-transpeptidase YcbB/YkuD